MISLRYMTLQFGRLRLSNAQCQNRTYRKTQWGPNNWFRPGTTFIGVQPHPLKYYGLMTKKPDDPYGIQGSNHLLPGKGVIAGRLPVKMRLKKDKVYSWCSCGMSHNQPLCDGSHNRESTNLRPVRFIPDKDVDVWFCMCKQTKTRPFCDGTHETLPPPVPPPSPTK